MERRVIVGMNNQPLVSVPVITYNSSKFVLETLESIKAQTYQNIELIISDDCSTDNTVELCRKWVEQNKNRFVRTQIITSEVNTGVSANLNRAEAACQGEWVKGIAGDDLLMPNCIADCVEYVQQHPNIIYLFGRIEAFGANEERNKYFTENIFDYSFFNTDVEAQLDRLVFGENCIPASTCFYDRNKAIELGIRNDERIPLLEDWPKWITILENGVKLEFMDKVVVKYRIHDASLSTSKRSSVRSVESMQLFNLYYRYPLWILKDQDNAIKRVVNEYTDLYKQLLEAESEDQSVIHSQRDQYKDMYKNCQEQLSQIRSSKAYRLGKIILTPLKKIKQFFKS